MNAKVTIEIDGEVRWVRETAPQPSTYTANNLEILTQAQEALAEASVQLDAELQSLAHRQRVGNVENV